SDALVRNPEELETLADQQSNALFGSDTRLFDLNAFIDEQQFQSGDPVFDYVANSSASMGERLTLLRQHFRHRMFSSISRDVTEQRPIYSSFAESSAAADSAISAAFGLAGNPRGVTILALGRLGTREFDLLSDADLLFVCDPREDRIA